MLTQVWAAEMTHKNPFNGYIVSRFVSGFTGGVTGTLGPRMLVDVFFLHQRGRAFTAFHWCLNFGSMAGPTLSAFIAANRSWTLEFWWTVGLVGAAVICCFFFLHETAWDRENEGNNPSVIDGFVANRFATFFVGDRVTPKSTSKVRAKNSLCYHFSDKNLAPPRNYSFPYYGITRHFDVICLYSHEFRCLYCDELSGSWYVY